MIKGSFLHWFRVKKTKKKRAVWGLPDGPDGGKKSTFHHIVCIAFYRDNDLKLKFDWEKKVDILTKEANAKKNGNIFRSEESQFLCL